MEIAIAPGLFMDNSQLKFVLGLEAWTIPWLKKDVPKGFLSED